MSTWLARHLHVDLVGHGGADRALGAEALLDVVPEVVVAAGEVRKDRILSEHKRVDDVRNDFWGSTIGGLLFKLCHLQSC